MVSIYLPDRVSARPTVPALRGIPKWREVAVCLLLVFAGAAHAEELVGKVIKIAEGDTLTLLTADKRQHKIRLAGVDAPEKKQPFGNRCRQNLARLAHGKEAQADCPKRDRYGRYVCKVYVGGQDVRLREIYDGTTRWRCAYAHGQCAKDRQNYETASARRASINGDCGAI